MLRTHPNLWKFGVILNEYAMSNTIIKESLDFFKWCFNTKKRLKIKSNEKIEDEFFDQLFEIFLLPIIG